MSTPNIIITQITMDQLDDVLPMFQAYHTHYKYSRDSEECRAFLSRRLISGTSYIFVAYLLSDDGAKTPVGFTQLYPSFSSLTLEENFILNDLWVNEEYRSLKIGSTIINLVLKWADEEKLAFKLYIETTLNNLRAQYLYPKLGFVESHRHEDTISYCFKFKRARERVYNSYYE